ncbi:hypothetical protein KAR91_71585 [Candidatus Pacearchaeota archaeon]|nr:hypothetical protein [Candidatus Pacearchaeota archaeon]
MPCRNYTLLKERYPDTRFNGINDSLSSILENTENLSDIEVLLKLDDDDPDGYEYITKNWIDKLPIHIELMEGSWRRSGVAIYSNRLASLSNGEFVWWWSDEVVLTKKNWDSWFKNVTKNYVGKIYFVTMLTQNAGYSYPCLSKEWINNLGLFTKFIALDSFNNFIAEKMKNKRNIVLHEYTLSVKHHYEIFPTPKTADYLIEYEWPSDPQTLNTIIQDYANILDQAILANNL